MGTRKIRSGAGRDSALEAATQLLAEREKYEQWIEDLEAKKDSTPAKVFDRVRQDYVARLQTVMEQLEQYTATLQEHAETLMAKLRDLEEAEEENNEAQEEAAIRKQVGEVSAAEWESGSRKAQRELAKIKENQTVVLADLNRIRDLLGDEDEEPAKPAPPPKSSASKGSKKDFNELEFLTSVVGTEPAAPPPRSTPTSTPTRATPTSTAPPAPPPTPAAPAPPPPPTAAPAAPPTAAQEEIASKAEEAKALVGVPEEAKTLKCQECSAMNYPTEWYCERCGAELTVV